MLHDVLKVCVPAVFGEGWRCWRLCWIFGLQSYSWAIRQAAAETMLTFLMQLAKEQVAFTKSHANLPAVLGPRCLWIVLWLVDRLTQVSHGGSGGCGLLPVSSRFSSLRSIVRSSAWTESFSRQIFDSALSNQQGILPNADAFASPPLAPSQSVRAVGGERVTTQEWWRRIGMREMGNEDCWGMNVADNNPLPRTVSENKRSCLPFLLIPARDMYV